MKAGEKVRCGMCQDMVDPADAKFLDYPDEFNTDEKFIVCKWCVEYAHERVGIPREELG